tara:strand:- start:68 stop:946 length:879 start_codon:yes stop_codon:yes gene_type:complete
MTPNQDLSGRGLFFKKVFGEPLVVFILLTAAIFIFDLLSRKPQISNELQQVAISLPAQELFQLDINDSLLSSLKERFFLLRGRQASEREVEKLIEDWIKDEMIFRHALSQNMHLGDPKIKAQLVEKMSLLWAGVPAEPQQQEILNFYMNNIQEYYSEPRISFSQVFFEQLPQNYNSVLQKLLAGNKVVSDGYWLGDEISNYTQSIILSTFGSEFYTSLVSYPPGQWGGPLKSPRGYHFVRHEGIEEPAPLKFSDIYERVRRNVLGAEQGRRIDEQVAKIESQFSISLGSDED